MTAALNGAPWTPTDVRRLRQLAARGHSAHAIAGALGRTYSGVVKRAVIERLSLSTRRRPKATPAR